MAKESLDKVPPQNLEAEQSVLGSLLIDKNAIIKVADIIMPDDFYKDAHGLTLESMIDLYEKREPIDVLSLASRLEDKDQLETIGGRSYLATLANAVPTSANVVSYAKIVQQKATLRRLLNVAADITQLGYNETDNIEELLDQAEQNLFSVSQKYLKQNFVPIKSILTEAFDRIDELHKESGKLRGIPTGFKDLDNILAGFQKSDLIILAARPSMGKTTLALDIARQIAVEKKIPVGIFSLEMSKEQLVDRLLCAQSGVELWKMRTGKLSEDEDFTSIGHAMGILSEAPIYIDDSATANIMEIRTKARRLHSEHNLGVIVLDYLQLMQGVIHSDNRVQEISEITRSLKAIARELNIPVLVLSQLSRAVESRTPSIPKLADLRESGSIEQDADVVMFIYRESMYKNDLDVTRKNIADIYIAKHRNGPTGKIQLYFDENKVSFKNLEKKLEAETPF
ncbi:replicative DNA helicase [Patescibacteria group bacterium]|nr:replicative DNA helicase [Patescibacteria group bacterium]